MPAVLEGAVPPPHLHLQANSKSWPSSYSSPVKYPAPTSSPMPMSPESLPSYIPNLHDSPVPSHQDLSGLPSSGWYANSVPAPDAPHEAPYGTFSYGDQPYVATPGASSVTFSPPTQFAKVPETSNPIAKDGNPATFSPVSQYSHLSDQNHPDYVRPSDESYMDAPRTGGEIPAHVLAESTPARPRSSPSSFTPHAPSSGPLGYPYAMNPLGISSPMHDQFYSDSSYPPRRLYAPIAPHPVGSQRTSAPKRSREDDEVTEDGKRRKRSDSNTSNVTIELGEEDRLLIQLKDEESMPWKDIANRFQTDLGKTYQIPALQMRLKRLRERMRVWTETDVRALRMAHEYWVQSKFDIIAQKMLEYGAAEKWTARQCARKWAEIDPGPTPYTTYDHHATSYAPYTMSPVEQGAPFMPYLHIP